MNPRHLCSLLAMMRALRWNYQTCHWQASGDSYYGDHIMFQRMYEGMDDEIDSLAEKIIGSFGPVLDSLDQASGSVACLYSWSAHDCPYRRSIQAETDLQGALRSAHQDLESAGLLTLGMDDLLSSISGNHETNLYLLRQRLGGVSALRKASAHLERAWHFLKFADGVKRRDQNPDYRAYVERKRKKNEKPMSHDEWDRWMFDGDRPDSAESIKDDARERGDAKELSKREKAIVEKKLKKFTKGVRKAIRGLPPERVVEVVNYLDDKKKQAEVEKELQEMKQRVRGKFREEISEELSSKDIQLNRGDLSDSDKLDAVQSMFKDKKVREQFTESLARNLPEEMKKSPPPSFLAYAIQHVLDSMLDFARTEGYESAEDRMKRYDEYSHSFDKDYAALSSTKKKIEEHLSGSPPEDEDEREEWFSELDSLVSRHRDKSYAIADSTLDYLTGPGEEEKKEREMEKAKEDAARDEIQKRLDKAKRDSTKSDRAISDVKKEIKDLSNKREDIAQKSKALVEVEKKLRGVPADTEEHAAIQKEIAKAKESLRRSVDSLVHHLTPRQASESSKSGSHSVADWLLDGIIDGLVDMDDDDVAAVITSMGKPRKANALDIPWTYMVRRPT